MIVYKSTVDRMNFNYYVLDCKYIIVCKIVNCISFIEIYKYIIKITLYYKSSAYLQYVICLPSVCYLRLQACVV